MAAENAVPMAHVDGYNTSLVAMPNSTDVTPESVLWKWNAILARYSECDMTFMSDRLIGIAGLAKETHKALTFCESCSADDVTYLAGLWRVHIEIQLLWRVSPRDSPKPRPKEYRAPTWSWASVDSRFEPTWVCEDIGRQRRLIYVRAGKTSSPIDDGFVQVFAGELEVETALWKLARCTSTTLALKLDFIWDIDDSTIATSNQDLYLMPACIYLPLKTDQGTNWNGEFVGLILQVVEGGRFERVGRAHASLSNRHERFSDISNFPVDDGKCTERIGTVLVEQGTVMARHILPSEETLVGNKQNHLWERTTVVMV